MDSLPAAIPSKENAFFSLNKHQLPLAPELGMGSCSPPLHLCWDSDRLERAQVTIAALSGKPRIAAF